MESTFKSSSPALGQALFDFSIRMFFWGLLSNFIGFHCVSYFIECGTHSGNPTRKVIIGAMALGIDRLWSRFLPGKEKMTWKSLMVKLLGKRNRKTEWIMTNHSNRGCANCSRSEHWVALDQQKTGQHSYTLVIVQTDGIELCLLTYEPDPRNFPYCFLRIFT